MITFYLKENDPVSADILEAARELVLAHKVVYAGKEIGAPVSIPKGAEPPLLLDDEKLVAGFEDIMKYLEGLGVFLAEWQKFQSDACYCDEHGNII